MKLPFGWLPGHWGLKGKTREIARAEYELEGYELAKKLAQINYEHNPELLARELRRVDLNHEKITHEEFDIGNAKAMMSGITLELELLRIQHRYGRINGHDLAIAEAKLQYSGQQLEIELLKIEYEHTDMSETEYQKKLADIKGEPFITIIESEYDAKQDINGFYFEFDWNAKWIELLVANGYTGFTEDQIVQRWFEDLCRGVIAETMQDQPLPFNSSRVINRFPRGDGTTDYS